MDQQSLIINVAALVFSLVALLLSTYVAVDQARIMRQANSLPITIDLFREFRSPEFKVSQAYVLSSLRDDFPPINKGLRALPEPAFSHARIVSHFFDNLGVFVANNIVSERLVVSFIGDTLLACWSVLEPYILQERQSQGFEYQTYFEDLVARARANPPQEARRKLGLRTLPSYGGGKHQESYLQELNNSSDQSENAPSQPQSGVESDGASA